MTAEIDTATVPPERSAYLTLSTAVVCISVGSILVRMAQAPALAVAFHRIFLATVLVAAFGLPSLLRSWPGLGRAHRWALIGSGLALGIHFATWIASLSFTSVAASVLLVNTAPLFTLGFSRVLLGETVPSMVMVAMGVALAGAALIAIGDWAAGSLLGDALAVAGAVTLSLYHVAGRGLRGALPLRAYVFGVWGTAALTIALLALGGGVPLVGYPPRTLLLFLALAVVPTLLGHGLVNRSLRGLPAATVGLFLLGEPVLAAALAYALFAEWPGGWAIAGGVVILAALATVTLEARTRRPAEALEE